MRFRIDLDDQGFVESFARVCSSLCRVSKNECPIRITTDSLSFVVNDVAGETGTWLQYSIPASSFAKFVLIGYTAEANEIVMTVNMGDLAKSVAAGDTLCKIKLSAKNKSPHLEVQLIGSQINHSIPVRVVTQSTLSLYTRPTLDERQMLGVFLPPARKIQKLLTSVKNLGGKFVTFKVSNIGELHIEAQTEAAKITVFYENLQNVDPLASQTTETESISVRLGLKSVYLFFSSFLQGPTVVLLSVLSNRTARFTATVDDNSVEFITGALVTDMDD